MARIVVTSAAYLGDVAPFVEPANRLVERGHQVTFLAPRGFHPMLEGERFDLAAYPLDFSPAGMSQDPEHERLLRHPWANTLRLGRYWMRRGFTADPEAGRASLEEALRGADLLLSHPTLGAAALPVAHRLGVPTVVGQLFPMMIPTAQWAPSVGTVNPDLRWRRAHRLAWTGFAWGSGAALYDRRLNRHRRQLGVPPMRGNALRAWTEAARAVVLVSRHYFGDEPADWGDWRLGGFSAWAGPSGQRVDHAVDEFLAAGDPPVLVCLGTSAAAGAGRAFESIARDLERQGQRSLVLVGSSANLAFVHQRPGAFEFAPVPAVAPRCCAAVVSGALGTLAAALSAGLPLVVLPQLFDQLWHGRRVERLGVGIMVTHPSKVAAAVARLLSEPGYTERARALGQKLRAEDGAAALVGAVEATL